MLLNAVIAIVCNAENFTLTVSAPLDILDKSTFLADEDILEAHDMIDEIERQLSQQFNCLTTIHMDPIDMSDEKTNQLRQLVLDLVVDLNPSYTIHDFRLVSGKTHTNLIFDIVLPANDHSDEQAIKEYIDRKVKLIDSTYYTVIEIDHSYIG